MVLREVREKEAEAKAIKTPETAEEYTVRSILQDKKRNPLFAEMLKQNSQEALADKILKGEELSADELEGLDAPRKEFEKRAESVKAMNESLTEENFQEIAQHSPEFKKYVDLVGAEQAKKVLLGEMERMAMQENPEHFTSMKGALGALTKKREKFAERDEAIEKMCREYGISTTALTEVLGIKNNMGERLVKIQKLVDESVEPAQKIIDSWYNLSSTKRAHAAENIKTAMAAEQERNDRFAALSHALKEGETSSKRIDNALKIFGGALETTLSEDPEVRKALMAALHGKSPEKRPAQTSLQEAQAEIARTPEDLQTKINTYKTENGKKPFETDDAYEARIKNSFQKQYIEAKTKGGGSWATLLSTMLATALNGLDYKNLKKPNQKKKKP